MTPKAIHGMYDTLKDRLEQSMGAVAESIQLDNSLMTFEQFINNQDI